MSLNSISSTVQRGTLELLATQDTNLPGLTNNSGSFITVSIVATGQWSLLTPDFATSDSNLAKYKQLVDGDGYPSNKDFAWKYPSLNPGALVAEINNAQGNRVSLVSGRQQRFDLRPGETVEFVINDAPEYFANNFGKLTIVYSIVPTTKSITDLYNTGVDNGRSVLGDSSADSHYILTSFPADTVSPAVTTPNKDLSPIGWIANTGTARWIGPNTASAYGPIGDYVYKTTFTLPDFSSASIAGQLSVDDTVTDIFINGVSIGIPTPLGSWGTLSLFSIAKGFVVGVNTIEFKINSIGGPTGLRVDNIAGTYTPAQH